MIYTRQYVAAQHFFMFFTWTRLWGWALGRLYYGFVTSTQRREHPLCCNANDRSCLILQSAGGSATALGFWKRQARDSRGPQAIKEGHRD
jgi:hypothetical protein